MKKLTKLLLPSVAIMLVAVMALTGATYAWFQSSQTATVQNIETSVVSASGLTVSWDASHWVSNLTYDSQYYNALGKNVVFNGVANWKLEPVSTAKEAYSTTSGLLNMFEANFTDGKIKDIIDVTNLTAEGGYIRYDIYVQLDVASEVKVTELGIVSSGTVADTIDLATRVAFLYHGGPGSNSSAVIDAKASALDATNFVIWEPNATKHTDMGIENQKTNINASVIEGDVTNVKFPYLGFSGAAAGVDYTLGDTNAAQLKAVETTESTDISFEMNKGYNKLTVYVWVEGQDADCLNDLAGTDLKVKFGLERVEETVSQ